MGIDKFNPSTKEPEDESLARETGEKEEEVYDEEGREKLVDNDELSPREAAFMEGAEEKGELGVCANCDKPLEQDDKSHIKEKKYGKEIKWFCSDKCVEDFDKK